MISLLISRLVLLLFGTLYPAYASYKTVKTKNVKDYVRWMIYWIVYAAYTLLEIFADIFLAFWFPFYYELKILFVLWLVCPATRGSSYIFRKIVNPHLNKYEKEIDSYIAAVWNHGYDLARKIGTQGMDYLVEVFLELLRKGQLTMNNFMPQINEISPNTTSMQNINPVKENVSDLHTLDDDLIMTEHSETDEVVPAILKSSELVDESWSETEEASEKVQTPRVKTRSKRVASLRERKKTKK